MSVLLYLLVSGDFFWAGIALMATGAAAGMLGRRIGVAIALIGAVLGALSAVPVPWLGSGVLAVSFVTWLSLVGQKRARTWPSVALIVAIVIVASAEWRARWRTPSARPGPGPVFVLGDSLSAGLDGHPDHTWPSLLGQRIHRSVRNLAWPGARLSDGLRQAAMLPDNPCVVVIELGGNDVLGGATAAEYGRDLSRLLETIRRPNRSIVLFELPLLPLQNRFAQLQRDLAAEFGAWLIPRRVLARAVTGPSYTLDGLHLSPAGHDWLAARVALELPPTRPNEGP